MTEVSHGQGPSDRHAVNTLYFFLMFLFQRGRGRDRNISNSSDCSLCTPLGMAYTCVTTSTCSKSVAFFTSLSKSIKFKWMPVSLSKQHAEGAGRT